MTRVGGPMIVSNLKTCQSISLHRSLEPLPIQRRRGGDDAPRYWSFPHMPSARGLFPIATFISLLLQRWVPEAGSEAVARRRSASPPAPLRAAPDDGAGRRGEHDKRHPVSSEKPDADTEHHSCGSWVSENPSCRLPAAAGFTNCRRFSPLWTGPVGEQLRHSGIGSPPWAYADR